MAESDKAGKTALGRFNDQLWNLVPWAIPALVGGAITAGITVGRVVHDVDDLRANDARDQRRFEHVYERLGELADCVKRVECETVRSILHALDLRLKEVEGEVHEHNQVNAPEWKNRIVAIEANQQRWLNDPSARPDPFTGSMGRALEERIDTRLRNIEQYRAVDEHRMDRIEQALGWHGIAVPEPPKTTGGASSPNYGSRNTGRR